MYNIWTMYWVYPTARAVVEGIRARSLTVALYHHWHCMWVFFFCIIGFFLIVSVAFLTVHERTILSDIQLRRGPRKVGTGGVLQAIGDALKLLTKEFISVRTLEAWTFPISSISAFILTGFFWHVLPFASDVMACQSDASLVYLYLLSLLHLYSVLLAGWSSHSKYSFLGGLRTCSQLISYDIAINSVLANMTVFVKDVNINSFTEQQSYHGSYILKVFPHFAMFFCAALSEMGRHPFDLPEAEAELVSGYNVEYSAIRFAMFFLGEYLGVIFYCLLMENLFFGGLQSSIFFWLFRVGSLIFLVIITRAMIPRYRYDQLMALCWKIIIPLQATISLFYFNYNVFIF